MAVIEETLARAGGGPIVIDIEEGDTTGRNWGVAIDLGTSTVVGMLVDLSSGITVASASALNLQITFGEELVTRMSAVKDSGGKERLQQAAVGSINTVIASLAAEAQVKVTAIHDICIAGNTVMIYLLTGQDPSALELTNAAVSREPVLIRAQDLGVSAHDGTYIYCLPSVSRFVGGDAVGDIIASGMHRSGELSLLIDLGTNGELVFGNSDWLASASCASGPAFEGTGIGSGMRAMRGAVDHVSIDPGTGCVSWTTIGDERPRGICGSGIIDGVAELFKSGLISDQAYRSAKTARDLAEEAYKSAQTRYQIVEDRGIPISGNASTQLARVTAPMNGVVIKRGAELGDTITSGVSSFNAGTVVFTVADLGSLIVKVNLNEVDIAKVKVGQAVRITLDAYPQKAFTGKVRFVAPAADLVEKIKVFKVEIALDELTEAFRTGMSANVEILGEKREKAVSIPLEALQRRDGQTVVYRLKEALSPQDLTKAKEGLNGRGKFIWLSDHWKEYFDVVPVKAGIATLERVEILSGLKASDQVSLEDPSKKKVEKDDENN